MKFFRFAPLTLVLLIFSLVAFNQTSTNLYEHYKMPKVAPPAPDVAALEKFGNFPVSYSTGVPDISVPIWTIKCGSLNWPIALSYHAGGIKVDESASSAGLGFAMTGVGSITRSQVGQPDEDISGEKAYEDVTANDVDYLYSVQLGGNDSELDVFNYNFNGRSGKFVIKQSGVIMQVPQTNLKISAATGLTSFTITDEQGNTYLFDLRETSTINAPNQASRNAYNTWYLRRVELPNKKDVIIFNFTGAGQTTELYHEFTQLVGEKWTSGGSSPVMATLPGTIQPSNSGSSVNLQKLTSITFPNGSVVFNYDVNWRLDIGFANNVSNKLTSIAINESVGGITTELKEFTFYQSYFEYNPASPTITSPLQRRLRLDSLAESGMTSEPTPKKYKFYYNSTPLMPRESFGKDIWGFSNGVTSNSGLIQTQTVTWNNGVHDITSSVGNANRSIDTAKMRGWMLTSIVYPTGGKTDFVFEPHAYNTVQVQRLLFSESTSANGAMSTQTTTNTFTLPNDALDTRVVVSLSKMNGAGYGNPSQRSVVSLKDMTTGTPIYVLSHPYPDQNYSVDIGVSLTGGHLYELKATTYATVSSVNLTAFITATWATQNPLSIIKRGGGFRIKEMIHYTNDSKTATKDIYTYDTAQTLTPYAFVERTYSDVVYRFNYIAGTGACYIHGSSLVRQYQAGSSYPFSLALGSPMLYRRVQKTSVDPSTGAVNGKSEYRYDIFQDEQYPVGGGFTPIPLVTNDWKNGALAFEAHYKYDGANYLLQKSTSNFYGLYNTDYALSLIVKPKIVIDGPCVITPLTSTTVSTDMTIYTFPTKTGSMRLDKSVETNYDDNQNVLSVTTSNYYNSDKYDYSTSTVLLDSKNNRDSVVSKRAPDFVQPNNVYEKMEQKNMLAPIVEQASYTGTTQLELVKSHYKDWNADQKVMSPDSVQTSSVGSPLDTRFKYQTYDSYGNVISASKKNDVVTTYIYAYDGKLPIAEVTNATSATVAYTSFETDDKGGWTGTFGAGLGNFGSITGQRAWTQTGFSFSKSGLGAVSYTVSYWSKNGAYNVNSIAGTAGSVVNGWTQYTHILTPASGTITVTGSGSIDEFRLYPSSDVSMTTYTYKPLTGVTSVCDPNNRITYYEYDELQRLILIRDQDKNILKKFAYNYHLQTEYPNIYYNSAVSVSKYKQGCTSCQIGSQVTYTTPAGSYLSTESVSAANAQAIAEATAFAQTYANTVGTCSAPTNATVPSDNNVMASYQVKFHNNCTGTNYTYAIVSGAATAALSPAPPNGNYEVTFTQMAGPAGSYIYYVNGQSKTQTTSPAIFPNVEVTVTGNTGLRIN